MASNFDNMISEYKDYSELKIFSEGQFRVITDLSKKIQKLEEENKSLKLIVEKSLPEDINHSQAESVFGSSDPEIIARTQLALIKRTSLSGEELTIEEAKKAQIYTDILLKATASTKGNNVEALDTAALLKELESHSE